MPETPITIHGFQLSQLGVAVEGQPTVEAFQGCLDFVLRTHWASGWWLCDLIVYMDSRDDWGDLRDALIDAEALSESSVRQYRYLGKAIPPSQRVPGVGFGHHGEVAALPPVERTEWLQQAKAEGWSSRELRQRVKVAKAYHRRGGPTSATSQFRVVVVAPVWGPKTVEALSALPVSSYVLPDAVLFLWVPSAFLLAARDVVEAWGATYQTSFVWSQVLAVPTPYVALSHELLLVATWGECEPVNPEFSSVQTVRRRSLVEGPPPEFLNIVERMYPSGPYVGIGVLEGRLDWVLWSMAPSEWVTA